MVVQWVSSWACAIAALTTVGWEWPTEMQTFMPRRSVYFLLSTSQRYCIAPLRNTRGSLKGTNLRCDAA